MGRFPGVITLDHSGGEKVDQHMSDWGLGLNVSPEEWPTFRHNPAKLTLRLKTL